MIENRLLDKKVMVKTYLPFIHAGIRGMSEKACRNFFRKGKSLYCAPPGLHLNGLIMPKLTVI